MIIKSGTRKTPTFSQLIDYMNKEEVDKRYRVLNNLYGEKGDYIKDEFLKNSKFVKVRKNGNYLYHEVLSISKTDALTNEEHKDKLKQICGEYIERRAKNNLAYAVLHEGKNNDWHYHVMFSANEKDSNSKTRLSTPEFDRLKKKFNEYVLEKYPELNQVDVISKKNNGEKISQKAYEVKKRAGKLSQTDRIKASLRKVFETSSSGDDFFRKLEKENLKLNPRSKKTISFTDIETKRNFRVSTLGLTDEFHKMSGRIELEIKKAGTEEKSREQAQKQYKEAQGQREQVKTSTQDTRTNQESKKQEEPQTSEKKEQREQRKRSGGKQYYQDSQARQEAKEQKYKQQRLESQRPEPQERKNQAEAPIKDKRKEEKTREQVEPQHQKTQAHLEKVQRAKEELRILRERNKLKTKTKTKKM